MKQEPLAWINKEEIGYMHISKLNGAKDWKTNLGLIPEENDIPLYTEPQYRELSDEEIKAIENLVKYSEIALSHDEYMTKFARAILMKAREK